MSFQVMVKHLKEQLGSSRVDSEQLATLRVRTTTLEAQVTDLLAELQDARQNHTPVSLFLIVKVLHILKGTCCNNMYLSHEDYPNTF